MSFWKLLCRGRIKNAISSRIRTEIYKRITNIGFVHWFLIHSSYFILFSFCDPFLMDSCSRVFFYSEPDGRPSHRLPTIRLLSCFDSLERSLFRRREKVPGQRWDVPRRVMSSVFTSGVKDRLIYLRVCRVDSFVFGWYYSRRLLTLSPSSPLIRWLEWYFGIQPLV